MNDEPEIFLRDGGPEAQYANYFEVGFNAFEFLVGFGQSLSESDPTQVQLRIITSPRHAKTLCDILSAAIDRYEQTFGQLRGA